MTDGDSNFAQFEAQAMGGDTPADAKAPAEVVTTPEADKAADEPLELTDGDEAVDVAEDEDGGEPDPADDKGKRRSKPASQRIAEERWRRGEAERERDELRARIATLEGKPAETVTEPPVEPDPADFEFGAADPEYTKALIKHSTETEAHKRSEAEAERSKADAAVNEQRAMQQRVHEGVQKAETDAKAKYEDFDARIEAAVEARGGEPLPPVLTVALGVSPVGGDLIYRLATDDAVSEKLEKLAKGGPQAMNALALAMGELEGEYIDGTDDSDLDTSDPLDMQRMLGRMRARLAGKGVKAKPVVKPTEAPEPPEHRARGGAGRFEVAGDTKDFAAFEAKVMGR